MQTLSKRALEALETLDPESLVDVTPNDIKRAREGLPIRDPSYYALHCAVQRADQLDYWVSEDQIRALAVAVISQAVADLTDTNDETRRAAYEWIHGGLWRTHWAYVLGVHGKREIFLQNLRPYLVRYDRLEAVAPHRVRR